jgi:hypothetical protein
MTEAMPVRPDVRLEVLGLMQSGYHLSQILEERARGLEIRGLESFREALVHGSEHIAGLITLSAFAEQAGRQQHA